ncbi:hypothetical protein ACP275_08G049500 [Erythranthe tilingii]
MGSSMTLSYVPIGVGYSNRKVGVVGSRIQLNNRKVGVVVGGGSSVRVSSSAAATAVSEAPWLMLPPSLKKESTGKRSAYNFYSLAEDKVVSIHKSGGGAAEEKEEMPDDDAKVVGSSHGWLSLFNHSSNGDLFLSNPLTRRHIKLPSVDPKKSNLVYPGMYNDSQWVTSVVISCSPDEQDCRAVMTFTPENRMAFCCPGRSSEWTPIGDLSLEFDEHFFARDYEDIVYSPKQNLFFCATTYGDFEAWDLSNPNSPVMTPLLLSADDDDYPWAGRSIREFDLKKSCYSKKSLVIDEKTDQLFHVRRFVRDKVRCGFLYYNRPGMDIKYKKNKPYKTVGFDVHKIDIEKGELRYMDRSLDGLAMFVGRNHSFAVRAPELKPDSIYFTDVCNPPYWLKGTYGGHDNGIFNYCDGTISPCFYPIDPERVKRVVPSPIWFTPTTLI